jgi:hypothetical protein
METIYPQTHVRPEDHDLSHRAAFQIGGITVLVGGQSQEDVALVDSLLPFKAESCTSDINLSVEWVESLRSPDQKSLFDSGSVWRLYEDGTNLTFDFSSSILASQPYKRLIVNRAFREATLQMNAEFFGSVGRPSFPLEYPLDELLIMHRLTQEKAIELHGCGIVRADGIGNLFVGHSGAGKSTTTRLWTALEDAEVLSDDRIIVRRDEAEKQVPHRRSAPVRNDNAKNKIRMYGTPWHGEAMHASPNSAPLARIFVLEHGHGNVLTPLTPSQAVAELFARAFVPFHRHEYVESALSFLQEVVDTVPVYRFAFEPDHRAVDTILNLRD